MRELGSLTSWLVPMTKISFDTLEVSGTGLESVIYQCLVAMTLV